MLADVHLKVMCEHAIRKRIKSYNPDVVVSGEMQPQLKVQA